MKSCAVPLVVAIGVPSVIFCKSVVGTLLAVPASISACVTVWDAVYDWSVRYQQPINILRRDDGRYTMTFMFTTLVLRPDQPDDYVSFGYDAR